MKKIACILICACALSLPLTASAQQNENRREQMVEQRAGNLADSWKLEGDARTEFIALYKSYQEELMKYQSAPGNRDGNENKKASEYTTEEAEARITAEFDRKAQQVADAYNRLEVDKKYYEEFAKSLSATQLMEIFAPVRQQREGNAGNRSRRQQSGNNMQQGQPGGGFPGGDFGGMDGGW